MSYLINNQQKVNDIVFANRNKNYGAYAIRSAYGNTLLKSIMIMVTGFGSVILTAYCLTNHTEEIILSAQLPPDPLIHKNIVVDLKPETPADAPSGTPDKPASHTPKANDLVTVVDSTLLKEPAITETVSTGSAVLTNTIAGTPGTGTDKEGKGVDTAGTGNKKVNKPMHLYGVDSQPEFEGGLKALYKFISDNMHYPGIASADGLEATVRVEFVVDENGNVGNLTLLNKSGYGFDEEALRVISKIPKFKKPAYAGGEPVKVYYQVPIKFRLR